MKALRYSLCAVAMLAGSLMLPAPARAQVGQQLPGMAGRAGHGHGIHNSFNHSYFPRKGPYGYGSYSHADRWRNSGHWHYYPSGVYRQGLRYEYVPGHYEWQQHGNIYPKRDPFD